MFMLPLKISWLIFSCCFWGGKEKFVEIRATSLSQLVASLLDFARTCGSILACALIMVSLLPGYSYPANLPEI